jgi:parvulin-like peptidyl-prolyl isomerase
MVSFSGLSIQPDMIVDFLKREMRLKEVCQAIVSRQIIERAAQERGLTVSEAEIQAEGDLQRRQKRLESASATFAWLEDQMMSPQDWEAGIRDRLLTQKLRESLFAADVERVFVQSRLDFEQVSLYRIRVPYQPLVQELFYQIEESEISFYEAAHLYDIDEQRRLRCGYDGRLHRWDFPPDMAAIVFGGTSGELLGPFAVEQGYDLLMVSEFIAAELTDETREIILERLFQEWLESELNYLIHNRNGDNA